MHLMTGERHMWSNGFLIGRTVRKRAGHRGRPALLAVLALVGWPAVAAAQDAKPSAAPTASADDPCDGLLAILDRPTVADSTCVVKNGHLIAELGYQNGPIKGSSASRLAFFPQAELRYGLPADWELKLFPPNYVIQTQRGITGGGSVDGLGDTAFGVKHEFAQFSGFVFTADAKVTVPTGNRAFSSGGTEANVQGIVSYDITKKLTISGLIGVSTLTARADNGSVDRFTSVNPDIVVTYQINDRLQLYSEVYGNTVTAPGQGPNYSFQGGVQYLLTKNIEVDASGGVLLRGPTGVQSRFANFGVGLLF